MEKINVVFIDAHRLVTNALSDLLNEDQRFTVVGETPDREVAIELAKLYTRVIFLVEINLAPVSGIAITEALRKFSPACKVIGLSVLALPSYVKKMINAGASGYVTKNSTTGELIEAILEVNEGKKYFCKEIKDILAEKYIEQEAGPPDIHKLTKRELEIIVSIKEGLSSNEIACKLGVRKKTIEVHRYNILKKLKLRNVASLVNYINLNGL